ncbi:NXPE family member 3-like [Ptychodera flava]|uniref:NXPE family member 3-like n=1 Tax=Ptychodera flava TaxID=63121 RepID=UPI00396A2832
MKLFQGNLSTIVRPTLLVIMGMAVGTYIYILVIENKAYFNNYPYMEAPGNNTIKRTAVNQCKQSKESEADVDVRQAHDVKFPYAPYNSFDMGWIGIVEEYEWTYKHLQRELASEREPLEVGPEAITPTAVTQSKVYLRGEKSTFKKGDIIHVVIETRDENGNLRLRGGDFLSGVMFNTQMQTSTAGRTVDYGNGTYSMYFYAGWMGQASINVSLSYAREAILFYDLTKYRDRRIVWSANFTDGKVIESSNCTITSEGTWTKSCSFTNTWALGRTAFFCTKPKTLPCSSLTNISQNIVLMLTEAEKAARSKEYLFEAKFRKAMFPPSPFKVKIEDSNKELDLPTCGPDLPIPVSSGYWKSYNTFVPLVCRSQEWTPEQRFKCASDKLFVLTGDSTVGQFSWVFNNKSIIGGPVMLKREYIALRAGSPVQVIKELVFESDLIDSINSSICKSHTPVVVFNYCFHYGQWSIRSLLDRVYQTKLAILRLFERCPGSVVVAKLAHPRDNIGVLQHVHSGNYLGYDMNRMLRRVLGGIGVHFLDLWDMVAAHPDDNNVHVGRHIIIQQVDMMLSHACPHLVKGN